MHEKNIKRIMTAEYKTIKFFLIGLLFLSKIYCQDNTCDNCCQPKYNSSAAATIWIPISIFFLIFLIFNCCTLKHLNNIDLPHDSLFNGRIPNNQIYTGKYSLDKKWIDIHPYPIFFDGNNLIIEGKEQGKNYKFMGKFDEKSKNYFLQKKYEIIEQTTLVGQQRQEVSSDNEVTLLIKPFHI